MNKFDPTPQIVADTLYKFDKSFERLPWSEMQAAYRHLETLDLTKYNEVNLDEDLKFSYGDYIRENPRIIGWRTETKEEVEKRRKVYDEAKKKVLDVKRKEIKLLKQAIKELEDNKLENPTHWTGGDFKIAMMEKWG